MFFIIKETRIGHTDSANAQIHIITNDYRFALRMPNIKKINDKKRRIIGPVRKINGKYPAISIISKKNPLRILLQHVTMECTYRGKYA